MIIQRNDDFNLKLEPLERMHDRIPIKYHDPWAWTIKYWKHEKCLCKPHLNFQTQQSEQSDNYNFTYYQFDT